MLDRLYNNENVEVNVFLCAAQIVRSFKTDCQAKSSGSENPAVSSIPTPQSGDENSSASDFGGESFNEDWLMDLFLFPEY